MKKVSSIKRKLIHNRLILAQEILEGSDSLPGIDGFKENPKSDFPTHPRHEFESVTLYLLLTCFDLLGQQSNYATFPQWLDSKSHSTALEDVETELGRDAKLSDIAKALYEKYNAKYGVGRNFYNGIERLPDDARRALLDSIEVIARDKSREVIDVDMERLDFLYSLRNAFTHSLDQYFPLSEPAIGGNVKGDKTSWWLSVEGVNIRYPKPQKIHAKASKNLEFAYGTQGWPFIFFECLYEAIGIKFDRASIKLNFVVHYYPNGFPHREAPLFYTKVPHTDIKHLFGLKE